MAKRGRKPTPTRLKILRGNPGLRPINDDEPQPTKGTPPCPEWIRSEAKVMWKRLVPMLEDMGILTQVDGNVVTRYCQEWAKWREAEEFLMANGSIYTAKDADGRVVSVKRLPQCTIANDAANMMNGLEGKLGLSPSDRTRLKVEPGKRMSDFDKFVGAG